MVRLTILVRLVIITMISLWASSAIAADAPYGRSKNLGISFQVGGASNWCAQQIKVTLTAETPEPLTGTSEEFQQMLGAIRAIISTDCPQLRAIGFFGSVSDRVVAFGESLKITNWVYVPVRLEENFHPCSGPPNSDLCKQRWDVFTDVRAVFMKGNFENLALTRYLSNENGADVEFSVGDTKGRVIFLPMQNVPFKDTAEFVTQQIGQQADGCAGVATKGALEKWSEATSHQMLSCTTSTANQYAHLIVTRSNRGFTAMTLSDFSGNGSSVEVAEELRQAMQPR